MSVFSAVDFADHDQVIFAADRDTGLRAIIAIHDTTLGPALGGCRIWSYPSEAAAIQDALRLARGMTYKAAVAGLPLGGGKSVIFGPGDPRQAKTPALMRAMGRAVDRLAGRYIVAEDVGTTVADIEEMRRQTRFVTGRDVAAGGRGNPSPYTARGVFQGIRAAVAHRLGRDTLDGVRVAVQGLGNVGAALCHQLAEAGARLVVADMRAEAVAAMVAETKAEAAAVDVIHAAEVDVFAPCALGACLNDRTIPQIRAPIVAGAANNQLAEDRHGDAVRRRGILYAPDYVINAAGLIHVAAEWLGDDQDRVDGRIDGLYDTLRAIFEQADADGVSTHLTADRLARSRLSGHTPDRQAA